MITDSLLVFDNLKKKIKVILNLFLDAPQFPRRSVEEVYQEGCEKIESIIEKLQRSDPPPSVRKSFTPSPLRSNFTKKDYMKVVEKAKEYIRAGDVIQVG